MYGDSYRNDSSSYRGGGGGGYSDRGGGGRGDSYGGGGGYGGGVGYGGGGKSFSSQGMGANLRNINWDLSALPVFEKNFYIEHPAVSARSDHESETWRKEVGISVIGKGIPKPVMSFEEASMPEYVLREVLKQGFQKRK